MIGKVINGFKVIRKIGEGSYGEVYEVVDGNGKHFAAKAMKMAVEEVFSQIREAVIQSKLDHRCLLRAHQAFIVRNLGVFVIIMDYCEEGDLAKKIGHLKGKGKGPVTQKLMLEIARGVHHLHRDKGIVHRDLKPQNILMKNGQPMISDYGISKFLEGTTTTYCGTPLYMPPEVARFQQYSFGADVWALGIIFLEMIRDQRITSILPGYVIPAKRDNFPSDEIIGSLPTKACQSLIVGMLEKNSKKRKTIDEVVKILEQQTLFPQGRSRESPGLRQQVTLQEINIQEKEHVSNAYQKPKLNPLQKSPHQMKPQGKKHQEARVQLQPALKPDESPTGIFCKRCNYRTKDITAKKVGKVGWYWFGGLLVGFFPVSFLPFVLDRFKDSYVNCKRCNNPKSIVKATCC